MRVLLVAVVLLGLGCSNKLSGEVSVDGKAFELKSCRSGQVHGFTGVDFEDGGGNILRLVATPTGEADAVLFAHGSATGADVGICGALTLNTQNSTINNIRNVMGSATLKCEANGHTVSGHVTYENCH